MMSIRKGGVNVYLPTFVVDELLSDYDASFGADGAMRGASSSGIQISSPILDASVVTDFTSRNHAW